MESTLPETSPPPSGDTPTEATLRGKLGIYLGTVVGVVALDVVTKYIVQQTLRLHVPVPVLGDFFRLTYIYNRGAAFGINMGDYSRVGFIILTIVAVVGLFFWLRTTPLTDRPRLFALSLVTAGAIGNLIDRIRSENGVVDFLDFGFETVRWPVFNVADIAVTIGAVLLAVSLWREDQAAARNASR